MKNKFLTKSICSFMDNDGKLKYFSKTNKNKTTEQIIKIFEEKLKKCKNIKIPLKIYYKQMVFPVGEWKYDKDHVFFGDKNFLECLMNKKYFLIFDGKYIKYPAIWIRESSNKYLVRKYKRFYNKGEKDNGKSEKDNVRRNTVSRY